MKKNDLIEDKLHRVLGDYQPDAPQDAWTRLVPHLPKKRKKTPFFLLCALAATTLLVIGFRLIVTTNIGRAASKESQVVSVVPAMLQNTKIQKQISATPTQKSNAHASAVLENAAPLASIVALEGLAPQSIVLEKAVPHAPIFTLAGLAPQSIVLEKAAPRAPIVALENALTKMPTRKKNWHIGIDASAIIGNSVLASPPIGDMIFAETTQGKGMGTRFGISGGMEWRRHWQINIGLQRQQATRMATHQATLRLIDGTWTNPNYDGAKEYAFSYSLASPNSETGVTLLLAEQHPYSTMPADEPFTLDMQNEYRTTAFLVPISVQRSFGNGKWQPTLRAGAVLTLASKTKITVQHFSEQCADLCFTSDIMPEIAVVSHAKTMPLVQFGAGITYAVTPSLCVYVEPNWTGNKQLGQLAIQTGLRVNGLGRSNKVAK